MSMTTDFFFFGTLTDDDIFRIVLGDKGASLTREPAELSGFRAVWTTEVGAPALVALSGAIVCGALVRGLDDRLVRRVQFFESIDYASRTVRVRLGSGQFADAQAFIECTLSTAPGSVPRAAVGGATRIAAENFVDWRYAAWATLCKPIFTRLTRQWMHHFDTRNIDAANAEWDATLAQYINDNPDLGLLPTNACPID